MLRDVVRACELALRDVVRARDLTLRVFAPAKHSANHDHQKLWACLYEYGALRGVVRPAKAPLLSGNQHQKQLGLTT